MNRKSGCQGEKMRGKERVRKWRERKTQEGCKELSVWLDAESARMFDRLTEHYKRSIRPPNKRIIREAIQTLYESLFTD